MNRTIKLAILPALLLTQTAWAQDWTQGWYAGFDYTKSTINWHGNHDRFTGVTFTSQLDDKMDGVTFNLGKRFYPWLSVEINYSRVSSDTMTASKYTGSTGFALESYLVQFDHDTFSIGPKFVYQLPLDVELYLKPSLDYTKSRTDINYDFTSAPVSARVDDNIKKNKTTYGLELGGEWFFYDNYALHLAYKRQYDGFQGEGFKKEALEFDVDTFKLGLNYYF
ncbi:outer membrane beta-barrel protein [Vibrio sinaloensis]|uniref:outer membrane beta-barrel protein n=1 Tax=Photobacterium sp. (strain ATCC 43367) TaxID=379097 RepID=UPI002065A823|nr:outer membrane beta-barrel protein [Vibrio sinaloensis]UPQ86866.1 porin family protein [Vibrio sinaloensis]